MAETNAPHFAELDPHTALPAPHPAVLCRAVDDGAILLHTEDEIYFGLDPVGAAIWSLLPPACRTLGELCGRLSHDYPDVAEETLRRDVAELLDTLAEHGLVHADEGQD